MIKTVKFVNFKSLSPQTVELGPLNVLIGANASGKSNFVDAFQFLHDCLVENVSVAVARRLGWRNTLKRGQNSRRAIRLELQLDGAGFPKLRMDDTKAYDPVEQLYALEVACVKDEPYVRQESAEAFWERQGRRVSAGFTRDQWSVRTSDPRRTKERSYASSGKTALELPRATLRSHGLSVAIRSWRFYQLDVHAARTASTWETEDVLMGDGKNLARVLESVPKVNGQTYERLSKLMAVLVPGFESCRTDRRPDGTVAFTVKEEGITKPFPPSAISDGTIRLLGVLLAVLHQPTEAGLVCIDEPERCVHPQILKTLVEVMREASKERQILVTTHSAELVRWLEPSEVLLVDKKDNQTIIASAQDVKHIEKFLKEFRLDELWLHGYLEGGTVP